MGREIKFRGWNGNKMFDVNEISWASSTKIMWFADSHVRGEHPVEPLMQFTGLFDKNGKEIFHSDLIRDDAGYLWQVSDGYDGFYLLSVEKDIRPDRRISERLKYLEVIGNIYESNLVTP